MDHQDETPKISEAIVTIDGNATSNTDTLGAECTCGTGTCCGSASYISTGITAGVYTYAAPDVDPGQTHYPWIDSTDISSENLRAVLYEEMLRDLLQRVQKLESTAAQQQQDILELRGSLDALTDIMDSQGEEDAGPHPQQKRLLDLVDETVKLLDEIATTSKRKPV